MTGLELDKRVRRIDLIRRCRCRERESSQECGCEAGRKKSFKGLIFHLDFVLWSIQFLGASIATLLDSSTRQP
jgi:hypothetical protein